MPSINLIPPEMLNHRRRVQRARRWLVGVGVAYTLALIPWLREEHAKADLAEAHHVMDTLDRSLDAMRGAAQASQGRLTKLEGEWARAQRLQSKRAWSSLITRIIEALPTDVWVETISTDPAAPSPAMADSDETLIGRTGPRRIIMSGHAMQIEALFAFERALHAIDPFRDIRLITVEEATVNDLQVTRFTVECAW